MKKVMISGVSGYIGSRIAAAMDQREAVAEIVGIDIRPPRVQSEKLKFFSLDVRAPLVDLMRAHHVDTVIHAAYVLPPIHDTALMEAINVTGTRNVLEAAAETGVEHLLYTSSTTAYGFHPDNETPLIEESPLRGNDDFTYAKNKKRDRGPDAGLHGQPPSNDSDHPASLLCGGPRL
ncbi:MAG: NAD-dependent epimerase/dehydratase family protein [Desulfobacteraceae bacterium]|nr:NAD-dependent epimerase/dehydratase family protein [Desulfobacteraceae bacterium]